MIIRYVILLFSTLIFACNNNEKIEKGNILIDKINDDIITNAKWYFYGYVIGLKAYDKKNNEINPLDCSIEVSKISKIGSDTTNIFFIAFNNDARNECTFMPYDLIGISIIKEKVFLPIYHQIEFDREDDLVIIERMNQINLELKNRVLNSKSISNLWLKEEAKKRE